jgi:exosortase/archaeosortase family protein
MIKNIFTKGSQERKLILFLANLFFIWLSWKGIIFILAEQHVPLNDRVFPTISAYWEAFNLSLVHFITGKSCTVLKWMGYETYTHHRTIWIINTNGLAIGNYCLGIQLMYYYIMLLLITPMSKLKKVIAIPCGIIITFFLNILRIISLCLVSLYAPQYMHLAHDHVFNIIVFGTLMGFYYYLIKDDWLGNE